MVLLPMGVLIVLRVFAMAAATVAVTWGTAISTSPSGMAASPDINCTQFNEDGSCHYRNCTEAKAHGECDIPEGSPHYCPKQDRDNDGLACEC